MEQIDITSSLFWTFEVNNTIGFVTKCSVKFVVQTSTSKTRFEAKSFSKTKLFYLNKKHMIKSGLRTLYYKDSFARKIFGWMFAEKQKEQFATYLCSPLEEYLNTLGIYCFNLLLITNNPIKRSRLCFMSVNSSVMKFKLCDASFKY